MGTPGRQVGQTHLFGYLVMRDQEIGPGLAAISLRVNRCMFTPDGGRISLCQDNVIGNLAGSLRFTEKLAGFGFNDKIRFIRFIVTNVSFEYIPNPLLLLLHLQG